MKQTAITLATFFVLLFLYTKFIGPFPLSVQSVVTTKSDVFTVNGQGKVSVIPDVATLSAGVTAGGSTVKQAQNELNSKINSVSEGVKKLGVDAKDIKTANYSIHPQYDYRQGNPSITGYQANSSLTIKVRKIENVNEVIDAATAAGANQIGGISFEVDDKTKAENQARELAVKEAKEKAESAAKIAGFSLGKIINYSENFGPAPRPVLFNAKASGAPETEDSTQVKPGSSEIQVSVNLSYEIR